MCAAGNIRTAEQDDYPPPPPPAYPYAINTTTGQLTTGNSLLGHAPRKFGNHGFTYRRRIMDMTFRA